MTTGSNPCRLIERHLSGLNLLSGLGLDGRDVADIFGALRMPGIVRGLHPGPDSRDVAKELAQPNCDGRGHRLSFLHDVLKMLARNPEQAGDLRLGSAGGRNNVIAKQRTGMSWATVFAALCRIDHVVPLMRDDIRSKQHTQTIPVIPG